MITKFKIKNIKNEKVLYLYFDFQYEIASLNKKRKKSIKEEIIEFINKNNIIFTGKKIIIVLESIVIATLFIATPINLKEKENSLYVNKILLTHFNEIEEKNEEIKKEIEKVEKNCNKNTNKKQEETTSNTNKNTSSKNNNTKKDATSKNNTTTKKETSTTKNKNTSSKNNNTKKDATSKNNTTTKKETSTTKNKNTSSNKITIYRSNGTILKIELEEYLIGVVAEEMPASFSIEALKAQAIVARTYVIKAISQGRKLTDTTDTQVYKDNNQLKKKWGASYNTYYKKIKKAVDMTKGMVITYKGNLIDATYFSTSNGYTEDAVMVWGNDIPYLKSVESTWDKNTTSYLKNISLTYEEISKKLGFIVNKETEIKITKRNESNRIKEITINNKSYTGIEIRTLLGLRSADFDIDQKETSIIFTTRGYGHGVGMSQYGANEMAKKGYSYNKIITHYYQGVKIVKK